MPNLNAQHTLTSLRTIPGRLRLPTLLLLAGFILSACTNGHLVTNKNYANELDYCWHRINVSQDNYNRLDALLKADIYGYQTLVEQVLSEREKAINLTHWIESNVNEAQPIPPDVLEKLNLGLVQNLKLMDNVTATAARNECWLPADDDQMRKKNLQPLKDTTRFKGFMVALSATLMLYDSYFSTAAILNDHEKVRRFLNQADTAHGKADNQLQQVTDTIFNLSNIFLVKKEIRFYEENYLQLKTALAQEQVQDKELTEYLLTLIQKSPSYTLLRDMTLEQMHLYEEARTTAIIMDEMHRANRDSMNDISKFLGNTVGLYEERKGKLYNDKASFDKMMQTLKPGDILLEKTPFRLTDKMIPGHWGHAAIWVGTADELEALGLWKHPAVKPYRKAIKAGHGVIEALRSGVEINSLQHFMNVDDVAVIRDPKASTDATRERILRAFGQLGKEYDFNYDVETTDKIVCSQLVYISYNNLEWPTSRLLGRFTISPDNIALKALNKGPLDLVLLYHDGKHIAEYPVAVMQQLMK